MGEKRLIKTYTTERGNIIEMYSSQNQVPEDEFYTNLAKIYYEHLQFLKQKKEA